MKIYFTQPIKNIQVSFEKRVHIPHIVTIEDMSFAGEVLQILYLSFRASQVYNIQGGSNITGTDLCVNKPHCAAAVRP